MLFIFSTIFSFMACQGGGGGGKSPESVAMGFLKSFEKLDWEKTKKYCTSDAQQIVTFMESMLNMLGETERAEFERKIKDDLKSLKKTTCRVEGDRAFCNVCCNAEGETSDDDPVKLKKVDGKWLVDMNKEDLNMNPGK